MSTTTTIDMSTIDALLAGLERKGPTLKMMCTRLGAVLRSKAFKKYLATGEGFTFESKQKQKKAAPAADEMGVEEEKDDAPVARVGGTKMMTVGGLSGRKTQKFHTHKCHTVRNNAKKLQEYDGSGELRQCVNCRTKSEKLEAL